MLEVTKVRVVYPNGTEALKSISFSAQPGEIVAIIGRSGAGKSTLLRCINGLQRPTSGSIILDSIRRTQQSDYVLLCHSWSNASSPLIKLILRL